MRVTLNQVAQRAGVSLASASRALNGESASQQTIDRVRAAALELSYIPDARAQSLKTGSTRQLTFAVADVGNQVYVQMMRAVEDAVRDLGYRVLIASTRSAVEAEIDLLRGLRRGYADGLIISPLRVTDDFLAELRQVPVPVVVIGGLPKGLPADNVRANSAAGVALAIDHLRETGRARIGFINGPRDTTPGSNRRRGFLAAMKKAELPVVEDRTAEATDFTFEAGASAAAALFTRTTDLDAVVAANDLLAVGTLHAAHDAGLSVPDDLAIVGMDDSPLASQVHPTLTSVCLGSEERGRRAAELLLERLEDPDLEPRRVVVQPQLVIRDSTRLAGVVRAS